MSPIYTPFTTPSPIHSRPPPASPPTPNVHLSPPSCDGGLHGDLLPPLQPQVPRLRQPPPLFLQRPPPPGHRPALPPRRRQTFPVRHRRLRRPQVRPRFLPLRAHQGVGRFPRDDPPLHDRHDHLRRHRRGGRRRRLRRAVLRVRDIQGSVRARGHRGAVRLPRRRSVARRPALLRHGRPQARPPLPGRARRGLRRSRQLRRDPPRRALHLHHHEPPPRPPQRQALQRGRRRGPHRQGRPRRRRGDQLGAGVDEPRHAVLHGPQRDGGQGGGQLLRPRRPVRRHRGEAAEGHRDDRFRAGDEGPRHERGGGRDRPPHQGGRAGDDSYGHGGRRDRRRSKNGADLRGDDDLRAEGGAPGAEGAGPAQRHRRHHRSGGGAPGADAGLVGRRGDRRRLRLQRQQLFRGNKRGRGQGRGGW